MNDLIRPALYDAWHPVEPVRSRAAPTRALPGRRPDLRERRFPRPRPRARARGGRSARRARRRRVRVRDELELQLAPARLRGDRRRRSRASRPAARDDRRTFRARVAAAVTRSRARRAPSIDRVSAARERCALWAPSVPFSSSGGRAKGLGARCGARRRTQVPHGVRRLPMSPARLPTGWQRRLTMPPPQCPTLPTRSKEVRHKPLARPVRPPRGLRRRTSRARTQTRTGFFAGRPTGKPENLATVVATPRWRVRFSPPPLRRASELFAFQPIPFRQAAYGFVDVRARLFDVLHARGSVTEVRGSGPEATFTRRRASARAASASGSPSQATSLRTSRSRSLAGWHRVPMRGLRLLMPFVRELLPRDGVEPRQRLGRHAIPARSTCTPAS